MSRADCTDGSSPCGADTAMSIIIIIIVLIITRTIISIIIIVVLVIIVIIIIMIVIHDAFQLMMTLFARYMQDKFCLSRAACLQMQ